MMIDCMICGTPVDVADELADAAIEVICASCSRARAAADLTRRRNAIGVEADLADFTFDQVDVSDGRAATVDMARRWAVGELNAIGLGGPVGTGKTRVAVAAANEMVRYRPVRFYSVPVLVARLGTGKLDAPERLRAVDVLLGRCALVLDDLDKVRATAYAAEAVFMGIDARVDNAAPLLVTTNLSMRELAEYWPQPWGEAIASRLLLLNWTRLDGPDRRAA